MAGYKETPRQKMIGMMYLVLTALLALNVSKDILNAFVIVNQGLKTSQVTATSKNELIYQNFSNSLKENQKKVQPYYDAALKAKALSDDIVKYISELRTQVIAYTEFGVKQKTDDPTSWAIADTIQLSNVNAKENYDKPMEILIGQTEDGRNAAGGTLKIKLEDFKKKMLDLFFDLKIKEANLLTDAAKKAAALKTIKAEREAAEKNFPIDTKDAYSYTEGKIENWVMRNFYHTVLAADVALLNKLLVDVKSVEGEVITKLIAQVDASSFKFDKIVGRVVSESNYILSGSEYKANIFLAAYDSKKSPDIYIGADTINHTGGELLDKTKFEDGMGVYTRSGSGIGEQKYTGWIQLVKPGETTPTYYNFASSFMVGQPSATVSADKMNVFYIGVDNPVTISVPGVANEKVHASASAGTLTAGAGGKYTMKVTAVGTTVITVSADIGKGTTVMGTSTFRIKKVPDPVAYIGGYNSGVASKATLKAAGAILPLMKDFDFELFFVTTSFTMTIQKPGGDLVSYTSANNKLTPQMITALTAAQSGLKVYFEDIKAVQQNGADKTVRTLSSISLKLTN